MKQLKTLDEHNAANRSKYVNLSNPIKNGIACPACGDELWDTNPMVTLTSHSAQKNVHCGCGYKACGVQRK